MKVKVLVIMLCWKIFAAICLVQVAIARPQFLTFHDGKIGVNFGGYHAEAGLGGLLGGNNAGGGLSASAGTPHGQQAGAGIGGSLNGRAAGGAYAGASAGYGVGASAALGGGLDGSGAYGGKGAESHAGGISTKTVTLSQSVPAQGVVYTQQEVSPPVADNNQVVQKVHKKKAHGEAKVTINTVPNYGASAQGHANAGGYSGGGAGAGGYVSAGGNAGGNQRTLFDDIFNIPISALRSVNTLLNNKSASGGAGASVNIGAHSY